MKDKKKAVADLLRALARGKEAIQAELNAKVPDLLASGGYIPTIDHTVPPDVTYDNFMYYLDLKRKLVQP